MPLIPPFIVGVVVGFFLKQGYDLWQRRNGASSIVTANEEALLFPVVVAPDNLEAISGIGPVFAQRLREAGVERFEELAALTPDHLRAIVAPIRSGHMIDADRWIAEARAFAETRSLSA